jgi:hypothetical protein
MNDELFQGGSPTKLYEWLRVHKSAQNRLTIFAVGAALVAWLPLAALAAAQGDVIGAAGPGPFVRDFAVHVRYLLVVPLLVIAQPACVSTLGNLARHFLEAGIVVPADHERFDAAISSTRRLLDSTVMEVVLIVIAYTIVATVIYEVSPALLPAWHTVVPGSAANFSPAGWWHVLVSVPLLFVLLFGWLFRLYLWARFLWLVSRMNLNLLPSHPDRAAGLRFAGYSINAHAPLAFALGAIVAAGVANRVVHDGATLLSFKFLVPGFAVLVAVLIAAPLLVFTGRLLSAWNRALLEYDALIHRIGREFERNWIARSQECLERSVHTPAFSATSSMFQLTANVYGMRFMAIDPRSLILLAAATLLPFIPVVLIAVPVAVVLKDLAKFLL